MLLKYMVSGMTLEIQLRSWLKNNMLRGITHAFKCLSSYFLILSGFFFLKQTFLQIFRLLWYANVLPNTSTSQPLKSLHRPQPMGKFAREIWEATGWGYCQEHWLHWPQTNVDFVAIPETKPLDVVVKQLLQNSQSWGYNSPWLKQ